MSAPDRSNSVRACVPVSATETSKPSLRSMYDRASENENSSSTTSTRATPTPYSADPTRITGCDASAAQVNGKVTVR